MAKYHLFMIFILLEALALVFIYKSSSFRNTVIMANVDEVKGSVKGITAHWNDYFALKGKNYELENKNRNLLDENTYLKVQNEKLLQNLSLYTFVENDSLKTFHYISANVVENSLNKKDNELILNVGTNDGVSKNMGVISSSLGVVGIVDRTSKNFSVVTSVLNTSKNISGKLKNTGVYGPLVWDKKNIEYTDMMDIPQHIPIEIGDTVVTSGHSLTFPEGFMIGTVEAFSIYKGTSHKVRIKLSNNFRSLYHVYVIEALYKNELDSIMAK